MNVLSLFDGVSCGRIALEKVGIKVNNYIAYEVDKNAIEISKTNYPDIKHMGSVVGADFSEFEGYDLVIGGFPCQDLSIGQHKGERSLNGERSGLFWELVRAIEEVKPKYFLVENNFGMPKAAKDIITETLKVEPIMIDSQLISGQRRKRLYWTNIKNVEVPEDKNIKFQDIVESGFVHTLKSYCLTANYTGAYPADLFKSVRSQVFEPNINGKFTVKDGVVHIPGYKRVPGKEHVKVSLIPDGRYDIRPLNVKECCRLQTMPENYFDGFKENASKKAMGNGWTIDVIAHIFKRLEEV